MRATAYVATHEEMADAQSGEMAALHILNTFDIPVGFVRGGNAGGAQDQTLWSTIANRTDLRYIVRGVEDPNPVAIDLKSTIFDGGDPRQVELPTGAFTTLTI